MTDETHAVCGFDRFDRQARGIACQSQWRIQFVPKLIGIADIPKEIHQIVWPESVIYDKHSFWDIQLDN